MKKIIIVFALLVVAVIGGFYYEKTKDTDQSTKTTSQVVENETEEDINVNNQILESTDAGKQLNSLKVSIEKQNYQLQCDEGYNVKIATIKGDQIVYCIEKVVSNRQRDTISINKLDINTNKPEVIQTIEANKWVSQCYYYQGKALYTVVDHDTWLPELRYGDTKIISPTTIATNFTILDLDQIYIRDNTALHDFNDGKQTFYSFNGTLTYLYEEFMFEWSYYTDVQSNVYVSQYDDDTIYVYFSNGSELLSHCIHNEEDLSGLYVKIGDYILRGNRVLCNSDNKDINLDYQVVYISDEKENDGLKLFKQAEHIEDIGNNMFIFTTSSTSKVYKGIIDESNQCILFTDTGIQMDTNTFCPNDDHSFYCYFEDSSGYVVNNNAFTCNKITYEY